MKYGDIIRHETRAEKTNIGGESGRRAKVPKGRGTLSHEETLGCMHGVAV